MDSRPHRSNPGRPRDQALTVSAHARVRVPSLHISTDSSEGRENHMSKALPLARRSRCEQAAICLLATPENRDSG